MNDITILKLGGSVLTDKKRTHAVRTADIKRICLEIKTALVRSPQKLVIVHGAGGTPHKLARAYFNYPKNDNKKIMLGIQTHMTVQELNTKLALWFHKCKVPAMPVQTSNIFTINTKGKIKLIGLPIIEKLIDSKIIPLLYGDMIIKKDGQFQVLSGDTIAMILANALNSEKIIFAADIDGVYTDMKQKILLQTLTAAGIKKLLRGWKGYQSADTTGELPGKILAITKKSKSTTVVITNGLKPKNVYNCLTGKPVGTIIK